MRFKFEDQVFAGPVAGLKIVFDVFFPPLFHQLARVCFQGVDAREGFRRRVVPFEKPGGLFRAPALLPAGHQPFRLRPAQRRLRNPQVGQPLSRFHGLAEIAPKKGIDEAGLRTEAALLGELHGLMDGGVVGNAVEPENLVEAEAQQGLECGLLFAPPRFERDEPVQRGLPADDAIDDFLAEAAVGG